MLIQPSTVLAGRTDNNPAHLEAFYKQGYELARDRSDEICKFLQNDARNEMNDYKERLFGYI